MNVRRGIYSGSGQAGSETSTASSSYWGADVWSPSGQRTWTGGEGHGPFAGRGNGFGRPHFGVFWTAYAAQQRGLGVVLRAAEKNCQHCAVAPFLVDTFGGIQ
jgi:hypothetical protein